MGGIVIREKVFISAFYTRWQSFDFLSWNTLYKIFNKGFHLQLKIIVAICQHVATPWIFLYMINPPIIISGGKDSFLALYSIYIIGKKTITVHQSFVSDNVYTKTVLFIFPLYKWIQSLSQIKGSLKRGSWGLA